MAKDNREDLTKVVKVDGGIEGVDFYSCNEQAICCSDQCSRLRQNEETSGELTVNELQRRAIKGALAEELADKRVLRDEVLALIDADERKIAELERRVVENHYKPIRASELTVTIDADVDEAVAGLKRLQREIRKTTQEVRELESACEDVGKAYKRLK